MKKKVVKPPEDLRHSQGDPYQASMSPEFPQPGMSGGNIIPPSNATPADLAR